MSDLKFESSVNSDGTQTPTLTGNNCCLLYTSTGAITFVEREAAAYDEKAVMENKRKKMQKTGATLPCGCPGTQSRKIERAERADAAVALSLIHI